MKIESLKGKIVAINGNVVTVLSDKTKLEHMIKRDGAKDYEIGQIVNMIIHQSELDDKPISIVSEIKPAKNKGIKMINFSSLINQMNKFSKRLSQNLEYAIENDADEEVIRNINEQIDYLNKGIDLFS